MMVNEVKNTDSSWQSTIPLQLPWMSSYEPNLSSMQFGQQPNTGTNSNIHIANPNEAHLLMQQQHPSMATFPTATTLTLPLTVSPTTFEANSLLIPGLNTSSIGVTTTTQSYPLFLNSGLQTTSRLNYSLLNQNACQPQANQVPSFYSSTNILTHMSPPTTLSTESYHKRSSNEMEDDQIKAQEPPTKQLLSESRLLRQFGSLHLDGVGNDDSKANAVYDLDSDDSEEDEQSHPINENQIQGREEFNRYVYLLFKDKKGDDMSFGVSNSTMDRLAREERDKLNKAVVLWNPPIKNKYSETADEDGDDEDEEEEFRYSDHTDFLKKSITTNDSITINEDNSICSNSNGALIDGPSLSDPDDVMLE